jgi:hypothetical protein
MFIGVMYKNQYYQAKLTIRDSLFEELKRTNPTKEVDILSNSTGKKFRVQIQELTLYGIVRNL